MPQLIFTRSLPADFSGIFRKSHDRCATVNMGSNCGCWNSPKMHRYGKRQRLRTLDVLIEDFQLQTRKTVDVNVRRKRRMRNSPTLWNCIVSSPGHCDRAEATLTAFCILCSVGLATATTTQQPDAFIQRMRTIGRRLDSACNYSKVVESLRHYVLRS